LPVIEEGRAALFGDHKPIDTLGVATLSNHDYLIEVDAIAVIDEAEHWADRIITLACGLATTPLVSSHGPSGTSNASRR
jgi:hypothetical protein